ncbi:MAG: Clp protease N-terminal domain-containing protein, partial [Acidimicrobiia bacterium]
MDINTFTQRSQQAIAHAQEAATSRHQQYVRPEHLLDGLLAQPDGIVYPIFASVGAHVT